MKLLKLEIGDLPNEKQFRSLHAGFKVEFHSLDTKGIKAMESFSPFCFAGLNGSGKSNVLEALAAIFYHLECCVAKFLPENFKKHFSPEVCSVDAFTLDYLIGIDGAPYDIEFLEKITISKKIGESPKMFSHCHPYTIKDENYEISLIPNLDFREPRAANGKKYLPDVVVGYSSGENEILSLPFRKSRLINFDKYQEDYNRGYKFEEPENSLIYIDEEMSQAVLLACLLYEEENALKSLKVELGITGLQSFRIVLKSFETNRTNKFDENPRYLNHIINIIDQLKQISTCYFEKKPTMVSLGNNRISEATHFIYLDFFIDDQIKKAFKSFFPTSFDLFRFFQVLYELNLYIIPEQNKEEIYKSKGFYTDYKIPKSYQEDTSFYFEDYYILKTIEGELHPKPLLLRELSDGEHQFLHTMGICLMLKNRKSLLLLDEPETHFNPSWRAKFIKILDDSIKAGSKDLKYGANPVNINYLKDILLTSHSPFIISDCMPNNVLFFSRNAQTKLVEAKKASELGLKTYGSSVDYILKNFFKTNLISNKSFEELKEIIDHGTIEELRKAVEDFGESSEKQFLFRKIYEKMENKDDNKTS